MLATPGQKTDIHISGTGNQAAHYIMATDVATTNVTVLYYMHIASERGNIRKLGLAPTFLSKKTRTRF